MAEIAQPNTPRELSIIIDITNVMAVIAFAKSVDVEEEAIVNGMLIERLEMQGYTVEEYGSILKAFNNAVDSVRKANY